MYAQCTHVSNNVDKINTIHCVFAPTIDVTIDYNAMIEQMMLT